MKNRHAAAAAAGLFPRNLARLVNSTTYDSPVPQGRQPSADYEEAMRRRDAREFWYEVRALDLETTPAPAAPLMGSRYQGGYSFPARSR